MNKVRFNYRTESWENREFDLPVFRNDFVILTPKDILTKDETWINRDGLHHEYYQIARSIPNEQLRAEVNNYFLSMLPKDPSGKDEKEAIERVIRKFPQLIEYYIRYKEDRGDEAVSVSNARVEEAEIVFVQQVSQFVHTLASETDFYVVSGDTHEEAMKRVLFLKDIIENKGGHRIFYAEGKPIRRESDLHILFRLTWFATFSDVSREVNDGRGPADFKISRGSLDKTIFEFKLVVQRFCIDG